MLLCRPQFKLESSEFEISIVQNNHPPLIKERNNPENSYLIVLLLLCAVVFFYGLGRLPFIGPDEPRYAEVAREMYLSGDWVTPRLGGIGWFEKPALTYWLVAVGYRLFGENEFAAIIREDVPPKPDMPVQ